MTTTTVPDPRPEDRPSSRRPNGLGPLGRTCPVCKAGAGQRCRINGNPATSVYLVHRARQQ